MAGLADARSQEGGYVAVLVAVLCASGFLFAMCAITIDTSRWYDEVARVQKAADQAALAGVPFLPQDLNSATIRAKDVAKRNGYDDASATVVVKVELGELPSRLKVTITSTITNTFGGMIGVGTASIQRTATADFKGPAPMGSPCNTFGNEPNGGTGSASPTPSGTAKGSSPFSNCTSRTPVFWANIEGPETGKIQGDRYQTRGCESAGVDGCVGTSNIPNPEPPAGEFEEFGYVFLVKVQPSAVNKVIDLQLYDPEFALTGQYCDYLPVTPAGFGTTGNANDYVSNSDARTRYSKYGGGADTSTVGTTCNGDSFPGAGTGATAPNHHKMTTSFALRQQTDSQDPRQAAVQNDTTGIPCIKQYGSYLPPAKDGAYIAPWNDMNVLKKGQSTYIDDLARTFHNWTSLCKFQPTRAGDYYLQVRTNVALSNPSGTGFIRSNVAAAAALTGTANPTGEGSNSFAIRAVTPTGSEKDVAVSGYNHMPIWINTGNAQATFNLIRVLPGAAGQNISFSYFDAGDSQGAGSVQVLPPTDASGSITSTPFPGNCKATGGSAGTGTVTLTSCSAPFVQDPASTSNPKASKNNGKTETITIPIPSDYNCSYNSFGGCWYRVQMTFGGGEVHDVTTWDASIVGDPVRLVH